MHVLLQLVVFLWKYYTLCTVYREIFIPILFFRPFCPPCQQANLLLDEFQCLFLYTQLCLGESKTARAKLFANVDSVRDNLTECMHIHPYQKKVHIGILYLCLKSTSYVPINMQVRYMYLDNVLFKSSQTLFIVYYWF